MRTKTLGQITAQYSRLFKIAEGNRKRQDHIWSIWTKYRSNIGLHLNADIGWLGDDPEIDNTELPRSIYASY